MSAKSRPRTPFLLLALLGLALFLGACSGPEQAAPAPVTSLNVALYPYVPDPAWYQQVVTTEWAKIAPGVSLNFAYFDCYSQDPPAWLDVFGFDGIFLTEFATKGFLRPYLSNEIDNIGDFLAYAINGSIVNSAYYGIPQIGCTNILYFRPGDAAMSQVATLSDLYNVLGPAGYTVPQPPPNQGLMMNFSGGTTDACTYLACYESTYANYTTTPFLPSYTNLDQATLWNLSKMVSMAGPGQAAMQNPNYMRAQWFNQGYGRAMVGFTESMSEMGSLASTVQFKTMPLGPYAGNPGFSLFFVDVVGVNAAVQGTAREPLALQLANLLASSNVTTQAFAGDPTKGPQYLMPVRPSVFKALGAQYPQYQKMEALVNAANPRFFRIGASVRNWLSANKDGIRKVILALKGAVAPTGGVAEAKD